MITGTASTKDKQADVGVNANAASTTTALEMGDAKSLGFYIVANSGTSTTHVCKLQISPNGTDWQDTTHTVTGIGNLHDISCIADYVRIKVTTAQGAVSTVDITVVIV